MNECNLIERAARRRVVLPMIALVLWTCPVLAQSSPPAEPPAQANTPAEKPAEKPADPPPDLDLDSLLNLPSSGKSPAKSPAESPGKPGEGQPADPKADPTSTIPKPDEARIDLDKRLKTGKADEALKEAVELMTRAADRLEARRDASLQTQRLQADAIIKLDQLIKQAEQQQQQQQQRSKQRQQQQQGQQQQQQQQGQQQQPGQRRQSEQRQGTNVDESLPPSRQDGALGPEAARGASWGALPARVREALTQGSSDRYSTVYQRLTELYYQRLAEEKPR
jgi:hypothetical protein